MESTGSLKGHSYIYVYFRIECSIEDNKSENMVSNENSIDSV